MKTRKITCAALLGLTLVAVSACGGPDWHGTGTVYQKIHHNPELLMLPISTGKSVVIVPISEPERWEIDIRAGDQSTHSIDVIKPIFDSTAIGSSFTIPEKK